MVSSLPYFFVISLLGSGENRFVGFHRKLALGVFLEQLIDYLCFCSSCLCILHDFSNMVRNGSCICHSLPFSCLAELPVAVIFITAIIFRFVFIIIYIRPLFIFVLQLFLVMAPFSRTVKSSIGSWVLTLRNFGLSSRPLFTPPCAYRLSICCSDSAFQRLCFFWTNLAVPLRPDKTIF